MTGLEPAAFGLEVQRAAIAPQKQADAVTKTNVNL